MTTNARIRRAVATRRCATAFLVAFAVAGSASAAELTGHRADYKVVALNAPPGTTVDGDSRLVMAPSCRGWDYDQTLTMTVKAPGQTLDMSLTLAGQESGDGLKGDYTIDAALNGRQAQSKIAVAFPDKGQPGRIVFTLDGRSTTKDVPAGLVLVASATQAMLERLQAGDTDFTLQAMGPTAPDGVEQTHVQVLDRSPFDDARLPDEVQSALPAKFWLVRITRVDGGNTQVLVQELHDNGVVARSQIEVSGLRLQMTAQRLRLLAKPSC